MQRLISVRLSVPAVPLPPLLASPVLAAVVKMGAEKLSEEKPGEAGVSVHEIGLSALPPLT